MRRTIALMGGSFNPPHVAHVMASAYALSATRADGLWWLPVANHPFPHKKGPIPFVHRVAMCRLALEPFGERAQVCEIEARLGGVSYTVDTLKVLAQEHPDTDFRLVVGSDVLAERHLWKDFDAVCQLAPLIVLQRPGFPVPPGQAASPPTIPLSSSQIRERLSRGLECATLVPEAVLHYIEEHALYTEESE